MFKTKRKKEQQKLEAFLAEYKTLAFKHGLDFYAALQVTERGIIPVIKVREIKNEAGGK